MYYTIREERIEELKEGRANSYIAKLTHYSRQYITYIFKSQIKINISTALKIINALAEESLKINKMLEEKGKFYVLEYFFKEDK